MGHTNSWVFSGKERTNSHDLLHVLSAGHPSILDRDVIKDAPNLVGFECYSGGFEVR